MIGCRSENILCSSDVRYRISKCVFTVHFYRSARGYTDEDTAANQFVQSYNKIGKYK